MQTETTISGLRTALRSARAQGRRIAFVPTMGYLHEGHLQLVDCAKQHGDVLVMSIFVNPLQFGPREDLAKYPRDLARDSELAAERGVDWLFAPTDEEMYPQGRPAITVVANELANRLCGHFRPGHFEGVLTVVAKLFNIVQPDAAVFGAKDFQQSVLIERMCADLDFPIEIVVAPTVREADGLAMSSRNVYLDAQQRGSALALSRSLRAAQSAFRRGETDPAALVQTARSVLDGESGVRLQYLELCDPYDLATPTEANANSVLAVAGFVGNTRLIDNMRLGDE